MHRLAVLKKDIRSAFSGFQSERLHLDIIVVALSCSDHKVDAVVVHFTAEHVASGQDELLLDEVFRILAELKAIQPGPIVPIRQHHHDSFPGDTSRNRFSWA
jgi:hypothetical protein